MTPLYDVISAYPLMHAQGIPAQKAKMAMALLGKNRHFLWSRIRPRHFTTTARQVDFSPGRAGEMLAEMQAQTASVISRVQARLPSGFPAQISDTIFHGLQQQAARAATE